MGSGSHFATVYNRVVLHEVVRKFQSLCSALHNSKWCGKTDFMGASAVNWFLGLAWHKQDDQHSRRSIVAGCIRGISVIWKLQLWNFNWKCWKVSYQYFLARIFNFSFYHSSIKNIFYTFFHLPCRTVESSGNKLKFHFQNGNFTDTLDRDFSHYWTLLEVTLESEITFQSEVFPSGIFTFRLVMWKRFELLNA